MGIEQASARAMTAERFAEIEARADEGYMQDPGGAEWPYEDEQATADARELVAEVKRLRAGIATWHARALRAGWGGQAGMCLSLDELEGLLKDPPEETVYYHYIGDML
jgi:hypothetical protein